MICNAKIVDGSGTDAVDSDLRIVDSKIGQVGKDLPTGDCSILNAQGLVLCPGFIDMHRHTDLALLRLAAVGMSKRAADTGELACMSDMLKDFMLSGTNLWLSCRSRE